MNFYFSLCIIVKRNPERKAVVPYPYIISSPKLPVTKYIVVITPNTEVRISNTFTIFRFTLLYTFTFMFVASEKDRKESVRIITETFKSNPSVNIVIGYSSEEDDR